MGGQARKFIDPFNVVSSIQQPGMYRKRQFFISIAVLAILFISAYLSSYRVRDRLLILRYDFFHRNEIVKGAEQIDEVLSKYEKLSYKELPADYKKNTLSDQEPFAKMLRNSVYYLIPAEDVYKRIVGPYRIRNFMPKDASYKSSKDRIDGKIVWLVDKRVLKKLLLLQNMLEEKGYDGNAFHVVNGYRHPAYNKKVGGASKSRHILGQAIDISIKDINKDGRTNKADKKIVLELLDKKIIKSFGGLGLYPKSQSVHLDVRGYRARWDSY
ncbi:MAG: DUF882 domain-containing protein [Bacteroidia bacterium]|nr:DUF882 domain-containing protein [Bacteroidia bacterium]